MVCRQIRVLPYGVAGGAVIALLGSLAGCGTAPPQLPAQPLACAQLQGLQVAAAQIGLPTQGAVVTQAQVVAAGGEGVAALGAYCKLLVDIRPVDGAAPAIKAQYNLPLQWNGKALMGGGGGYNGTIPSMTGNYAAGPARTPVPLAQGYATFSSDSGHQAGPSTSRDGSFGVSDEAVRNFSGDALKKTRDVAAQLMAWHYGKLPQRWYFVGGSTGGREALAVAQRWPRDFDGVIAWYPAWNAAALDLQFGRITRALAQPGAYPTQPQRAQLLRSALQTCDHLDGVEDGVVSNTTACNRVFDPATALVDGKPLRCEGGVAGGEQCLSDAQITALKVMDSPIRFQRPLGSGETQYPGFNVWGSDLGLARGTLQAPTITLLALGTGQPRSPMPLEAPYHSVFWDQWVRHFVTRDAQFDSLGLDPQKPGAWQARIDALTRLQDVNRTDLSAFRARGGKLLMAHGTADVLVSHRATRDYYERLVQTMGVAAVRDFARYYEVPGYGHAVSAIYNAAWDSLAALDLWVTQGAAPQSPVVEDTLGQPGRSRPLCEYPAWPRYRGSGDVRAAASFQCVVE
ncbi:tannase/feruloyl esterase family alpha/beta hydrolase [Comamonas sp. GB3 AK4-5]|uniref:tannase/feruloyl esterase family alpha/beta hydrolase n=1 Tax=Comamonas sp. GB3 AK4-5 TaxID=3231487 RepID=UPI00351E3C99